MLRRIAYLFSSGLLKLTLFSLAIFGAGWMTFGTPDQIKQAADEGKLYDGAVTGVLESAKKQAGASDTQLPLDHPEIQQAAKDAFPPELLSENSESIIDGFYGWLQGKTAEPEFSVDLGDAKQRFAAGVADYAQKRYDSLPVCTIEQLQTLDADVDPFTVPCRAPGLDSTAVRQKVLTEITSSEQFLADSSFTAEDLPKDEQGRTITDNLAAAPDAYQLFSLLPTILALTSAVLAAGVVFLADSKAKGLKAIGITLLGVGVFLGLGAVLANWSFEQMNSTSGEAFQDSLLSTLRSLVGSYNAALMKFYLVYIVVGAGIVLTIWHQNKSTPVKKV